MAGLPPGWRRRPAPAGAAAARPARRRDRRPCVHACTRPRGGLLAPALPGRPAPCGCRLQAAHVDGQLGSILRQIASGRQATAGDEHLEQRLRIAGEIQLNAAQLICTRFELLLYCSAISRTVCEDLYNCIRKGARIGRNDDVPLASLYIHATAGGRAEIVRACTRRTQGRHPPPGHSRKCGQRLLVAAGTEGARGVSRGIRRGAGGAHRRHLPHALEWWLLVRACG